MVKLIADKITFRGPAVDGGYKVTLEIGEYQKEQVAEILKLEEGNYEVTIKHV